MTIRPSPVKPGPGQESVWDYPRPPRLETFVGSITVELGGKTIASTTRAWRVLETATRRRITCPAMPFSPRGCCARRRGRRGVNGRARRYYDLVTDTRVAPKAAWSYLNPMEKLDAPHTTLRAAKAAVQADGKTGAPLSRSGDPVDWWVRLWRISYLVLLDVDAICLRLYQLGPAPRYPPGQSSGPCISGRSSRSPPRQGRSDAWRESRGCHR